MNPPVLQRQTSKLLISYIDYDGDDYDDDYDYEDDDDDDDGSSANMVINDHGDGHYMIVRSELKSVTSTPSDNAQT